VRGWACLAFRRWGGGGPSPPIISSHRGDPLSPILPPLGGGFGAPPEGPPRSSPHSPHPRSSLPPLPGGGRGGMWGGHSLLVSFPTISLYPLPPPLLVWGGRFHSPPRGASVLPQWGGWAGLPLPPLLSGGGPRHPRVGGGGGGAHPGLASPPPTPDRPSFLLPTPIPPRSTRPSNTTTPLPGWGGGGGVGLWVVYSPPPCTRHFPVFS